MHFSQRLTAVAATLLVGSAGIAWPSAAQIPTKNIYSFTGQTGYPDQSPSSDLAAGRGGNLYGVVEHGGPPMPGCNSIGCGTIYMLTPPATKGAHWVEQALFNFVPAVSGNNPVGQPLLDAAGNLYGTAASGGTVGAQPGNGTVWQLTPPPVSGRPWQLNVLHTFLGPDGATPFTGLVMDPSGTLFGTTFFGGAFGQGAIYSLTPPAAGRPIWTETVLHSFSLANNNVRNPFSSSLVLSSDQQTLYGIAGAGVFRLRRQGAAWAYTVLSTFPVPAGGTQPLGTLVLDRNNNLFGTTASGGASDNGTVFELSPPAPGQTAWTEQALHSFTGADGQEPQGGLVAGGVPMALFGTTLTGGQGGAVDGSTGNEGVAFRLNPPASGSGPWTYIALHAFVAGRNGSDFYGGAGYISDGLTFGRNGLLFGVANLGGAHKGGAVFVQPP